MYRNNEIPTTVGFCYKRINKRLSIMESERLRVRRTVGRNPENLVTGLQKNFPIYELFTYGIYVMAPLESF
jgi:hypothetical protein